MRHRFIGPQFRNKENFSVNLFLIGIGNCWTFEAAGLSEALREEAAGLLEADFQEQGTCQ